MVTTSDGRLVTAERPVPTGGGPEREFTIKARTQTQLVVRRFFAHKLAVGSLIVFVVLLVLSLLGQRFWKYKYGVPDTNALSQPPSGEHPLGTGDLGEDGLAQLLRGAQRSMQISLLVMVMQTAVATLVGAVAGYFRGWADAVLMRLVDLLLTLPSLALLIVLASRIQTGWIGVAFVIAVLGWAPDSRVVRGVFLSLREKEYVEAARALGARDRRIIVRHLLPNSLGVIIVNATLALATAILAEAALSYLGFGVQAPETSLGKLISDAQSAVDTRPWLFYFPGVVIILIALTVNFVGDGLRDAFDPTQTRVRA
jgi:ABC-type dipeptide/oligopeptide/nickel transport system permease subunit